MVATTFLASILSFSAPTYAAEKHVMVFGDSNAWGWMPTPNIAPTTRYPENMRWPNVMAEQLGQEFEVINESLSGRTAASPDPTVSVNGAGRNGLEYLPVAIASHMPLDLVVIMLGTNDTKPFLKRGTLDIGLDIMRLVSEVQKDTGIATTYRPAKVLVVVPPPLGKIADVKFWKDEFPEASVKESEELASVVCPLAAAIKVPCFDAGSVVTITSVDGVHMTPEDHRKLGTAIAAEVRKILP
jgi:lysophospholipase L1-like esterase